MKVLIDTKKILKESKRAASNSFEGSTIIKKRLIAQLAPKAKKISDSYAIFK